MMTVLVPVFLLCLFFSMNASVPWCEGSNSSISTSAGSVLDAACWDPKRGQGAGARTLGRENGLSCLPGVFFQSVSASLPFQDLEEAQFKIIPVLPAPSTCQSSKTQRGENIRMHPDQLISSNLT